MWSVNLIMGTISGKTHLKMIFSFSLGIGKQFIDNAICSSNNCLTTHLHFTLSHGKRSFTNPQKKNLRSQIWRMRGQGMGPPLSIQQPWNSLSRNSQTHWKWGDAPPNWKNVPTGTWCNVMFSTIARKVLSLQVLQKKKKFNNFLFHKIMKAHHTLTCTMLMFSNRMPQNAIHFLPYGIYLFKYSKMGWNSTV